MAEAAIARERGRRRGGLVREDARSLVVLLVARPALGRRVAEALLALAHVALCAVCKDMHARQREARHAVNRERLRRAPARRGVALVALARETTAVLVLVACHAVALDGRRAMARDARGVGVLAGERKAGLRVIELDVLAGRVPVAPRGRRVARAALDRVGEARGARRRSAFAVRSRCWGFAWQKVHAVGELAPASPGKRASASSPWRRHRAWWHWVHATRWCAPVSAHPVFASWSNSGILKFRVEWHASHSFTGFASRNCPRCASSWQPLQTRVTPR